MYSDIYKRKKKYKLKTQKKKKSSYCSYSVAWYCSYCSKLKKKKEDKVANKNGTVDEQWKTLYEQCKNTVEKRAQIDDWEKIKIKNKKSDEQYILNKPKVL